jgi:DNA repair exonuclease SbcCD ATPase subunit
MTVSASFLKLLEKVEPPLREVLLALLEEIERQRAESVTKNEFNEVKETLKELSERVAQLVEAQKRTEERIKELVEAQKRTEESLISFEKSTEENFKRVWMAINELREAQKKTEERINELAEAQKKGEERLTRLEITVKELAEAQKKGEERLTRLEITVKELVEAQKRTEESLISFEKSTEENFKRVWMAINELREAQKRTEEEIRKLTNSLKSLKDEVGGLSHTVGYRLEDEAMKALPSLLQRDMDIKVIGRLKRDFLEVAPHKYIELNIWGEGKKDGRRYVIIGEAKSQLKKRDVDNFIKKAEAIKRYIPKEQITLLVTYQTSPDVRTYAEKKGIKIYFSYEF